MDILVIHGPPGSGKTTVASLLQERLGSPWFEFGWIPEFRQRNPHFIITCREEEQLSYENLMLVVGNYLGHGFENILLSDLNDIRLPALAGLAGRRVRIVTLYALEDDLLRRRILDRQGENTYKDWEQAQHINRLIRGRPPLPGEARIAVDGRAAADIAEEILALPCPELLAPLPPGGWNPDDYFSYTGP